MDMLCGQADSAQWRCGGKREAGRLYLLTTVTFQRLPLFEDRRCAWAAARAISASRCPSAELLCWVLMPDHWQGLLRLHRHGDLAQTMRQFKGMVARSVNLARGRAGLVWEPGFHEQALRCEEDLLPAARYLVGNPMRAGLVARVGDYPYWNASWL